MNLLDKASIILTPTAYNNGEALCVKPSDGSFDFSRNSAATRVNAQGLVEDVQILSSNLVQNGDFSELGAEEVSNGSFSQQGSELVTNGDFSNGSTGWSFIGDTTIENGVAEFPTSTASYLIQGNVIPLSVKTYKLQYEVITTNGSNFRLAGGNSAFGTVFLDSATIGVKTIYIVSIGTQSNLQFYNADFIGSITSFSVVEVGQNWVFGTGWSVGEDKAVQDGTGSGSSLQQSNILVVGKTYKIQYEIINVTQGSIDVFAGFPNSNVPNNNTIGVHTHYIKAEGNSNLYLRPSNFNGSITNISVKEVGQNWVFNSPWEIGDNKAVCDTLNAYPNFQQSIGTSINKTYKLTYEVLDYSSGTVQFIIGNAGVRPQGQFRSANGTYSETFTIDSSTVDANKFFIRAGASGYTGSITNLSVIEITDDTNLPRINYEGFSYQDALGSELVLNGDFSDGSANWSEPIGWSISGGVANANTLAYRTLHQNIPITLGKQYKVVYDVVSITSGSVSMTLGADSGILRNSVGTYSEIIEYNTFYSSSGVRSGGSGFIGSIDNVSVKEYLGQEVVPDSGCGSWLWEPQSTNTVTYSEDFSQWTQLGSPTLTTGQLAPDGTLGATKISGTIGTSLIYLSNQSSASAARSIYARTVSGTGTAKLMSNNANTNNLFTLTEEWQRFELNSSPSSGYNFFYIDFRDSSQTLSEIIVWGAQSEELTYATSYIPTEGTQTTRNQDVCTNGGSVSTINSTSGVLYAEIAALVNGGTGRWISISDGTGTNRVSLSYEASTTNIRVYIRNSGGVVFDFQISGQTQTNFNKIAVKYKVNDFALWVNGVEVASDLLGTTYSENTLNSLQFNSGGGSSQFFGKTKCLAVWKEALTDTELQELTTI